MPNRLWFIGLVLSLAAPAQAFVNCPALFKTVQPKRIDIPYKELTVSAGPLMARTVKYQVPSGKPPPGGWPAVIIYQGTRQPVQFSREVGAQHGLYHEARLIELLLKNGFAVIAPTAILGIGWVTNIARIGYRFTSDYFFIDNILSEIELGTFGPIDSANLFATGISSGGYNSSRMAVSFPGHFKALAVQSGSYATCLGALCSVPDRLPSDHPPTLLLYGAKDDSVPRWTVDAYSDALTANNIPTKLIVDPARGHEWLERAPEEILRWFKHYVRL